MADVTMDSQILSEEAMADEVNQGEVMQGEHASAEAPQAASAEAHEQPEAWQQGEVHGEYYKRQGQVQRLQQRSKHLSFIENRLTEAELLGHEAARMYGTIFDAFAPLPARIGGTS